MIAVTVLKIDVEGAEMDVMLGLGDSDWVKVDQVVAEVHDHDGRLAAVQKLLSTQVRLIRYIVLPPDEFLCCYKSITLFEQ